jgi:hypothetical protein
MIGRPGRKQFTEIEVRSDVCGHVYTYTVRTARQYRDAAVLRYTQAPCVPCQSFAAGNYASEDEYRDRLAACGNR